METHGTFPTARLNNAFANVLLKVSDCFLARAAHVLALEGSIPVMNIILKNNIYAMGHRENSTSKTNAYVLFVSIILPPETATALSKRRKLFKHFVMPSYIIFQPKIASSCPSSTTTTRLIRSALNCLPSRIQS